MKIKSPKLFIEINNLNFIFFVVKYDESNNLKIIQKSDAPLSGIENKTITNFDKFFKAMKDNIYSIEKSINYTFNEIFLILENFDVSFINLTGFKKLNGSQILRENITYIINLLKSYVDRIESKKTILHIFNSKFLLDHKSMDNLPIGLFGDFYSHELSFALINTNDFKNLKNIFEKCNIKIRKILLKSYIKGAYISNKNFLNENFFQVQMSDNNSKIILFENNSLKFVQDFNFGTNIIIKDVCKITSLNENIVKRILTDIEFDEEISESELIKDDYFENQIYKKIKKKLIYEIVFARINEIAEIMIFRNINLRRYNETPRTIFFEFENKLRLKCFQNIYEKVFKNNKFLKINFLDSFSSEQMLKTANELVHFGWKREVIPVAHSKKSLIARLFNLIFR